MKNQQVMTIARWQAMHKGCKKIPEETLLYFLFSAAYAYCFPERKADFERISSDRKDFLKYGEYVPIPGYVVCYIRKVLYPEFLLINQTPVLLLGYEGRES
jgi:hypothetical protein